MAAGCALSGTGDNEASMGLACADFDGDGLPDLFLTHYYQRKNTLYRNLGQLYFEDDSFESRIAATSFQSLGFGTAALDYDRDGWPDLFVANGHVLGPLQSPNAMQPQFLRNDGQGRFADISHGAGAYFQELVLGRGVAAADYDNDGDVDLAVSHLHRPLALLRNDTDSRRHFLGIRLQTADRSSPAGARVVVTVADRRQVVPACVGGSYLSCHDDRLLIGLGDAARADQVEVYWPSGRIDRVENLAADSYWLFHEGRPIQPLPGSADRI